MGLTWKDGVSTLFYPEAAGPRERVCPAMGRPAADASPLAFPWPGSRDQGPRHCGPRTLALGPAGCGWWALGLVERGTGGQAAVPDRLQGRMR